MLFFSIAAKIYNDQVRNHIEPKIKKILRKNKNIFRSTTTQILTIRRILDEVRAKKPWRNNIICRFLQGLSKETVAVIMMLYKNTKENVRSPHGDTDYFDIVAVELQGDTSTCLSSA